MAGYFCFSITRTSMDLLAPMRARQRHITRRRRLQSNEQFDTCAVFARRSSQQDVADLGVFHLVLLMDKIVSYSELPKQAVSFLSGAKMTMPVFFDIRMN
jgi:hypothetical protein